MPSLFPTEEVEGKPLFSEGRTPPVKFGRSWRFDFERGEFLQAPTGRVIRSANAIAWVEWCQKAVMTPRYRHLVYTRLYGQEYEDLIARQLTRGANELEIKRITEECLKVDPRTSSVDKFNFEWAGDSVYFSCEVTSVRGDTGVIGRRLKL